MKFVYASGARPLDGYTIKRGVGVGGFGEVYFATSDAGKEVALKRVQRNLDVEVRGVTQCLNLKHPNLISLFDIKYDEGGEGWIVMEYVSGESLKDVIDRNPHGMPLDQVNFWFKGIAAGVAYLHDHGIVHRDLKPGNIFLDDEVVKIGDYGLSKFISCSRRSGQTESVGTFHYMAPEIGKGSYGKEIDVYALGIILFEMLTGRVPFEGESSQEIIMKHLTADPDLGGIAQPYRSVIKRAMLKDPQQRFSNVKEMLDRLQPDATAGASPNLPGRGNVAEAAVVESSIPPVIQKPPGKAEPLYILDDADEMVFGPLRERPPQPQTAAVPARVVREEPIAKAVRHGWGGLVGWWNHGKLSTPLKVLILVAAIVVVIMNAEVLVPLGIGCGLLYLIYYGIRSVVLMLSSPPAADSSAATHATRGSPPGGAPARPVTIQRSARDALRKKPAAQRVAELAASLLMSAFIVAVLSVLMMVIGGETLNGSIRSWSFFTWLTLSAVAGAWIVLVLGKLWEGSSGEHVRRRFVMLAAGLLFGTAIFGASQYLAVNVNSYDSLHVEMLPAAHQSMVAADGSLLLPAYLAYFAGLFFILRWWKQADPLRETRFSLWATATCLLWAWLLNMFWPFPQPWGFMLAATISVAVQLSAPWMSPKERAQLRHQLQHA